MACGCATHARGEPVEHAGGHWRLVYLPVERDELLRRLNERNQRADANALTVTPSVPGGLLQPLRHT